MPSLFGPQNVVDVEDIIAVLIVVAIILHTLAWLREDAARVPRRLILESWVADAVCSREVNRKGLEGLLVSCDCQ